MLFPQDELGNIFEVECMKNLQYDWTIMSVHKVEPALTYQLVT
jgi:hypothetical protein